QRAVGRDAHDGPRMVARSGQPPPKNVTTSIRSPSASAVVGCSARRTSFWLRSTATWEACSSSSRTRSATVAGAGIARGSPLTVTCSCGAAISLSGLAGLLRLELLGLGLLRFVGGADRVERRSQGLHVGAGQVALALVQHLREV